jgi:alcohol dehydrogenase class IV
VAGAGLSWEFASAGRIVFGEGRLEEVGRIAAGLGKRALVVEGKSGRGGPVAELLASAGVSATRFGIPGEPTTKDVERGSELARGEACDLVVAFGGGSVLDAGKAIAALLTNPGELMSYLEVVGEGRPLSRPSAPMIAIPTTAGTGSEVTRNAVLSAEDHRVKVSLRSPFMLPTVALVDPELTYELPADLTASTGLDALTQCIEPLVSPHANPLSDAVAREGIRRAARSLSRVLHDGSDSRARYDMAVASLCGGLALANAKLGAVHGLAAPLGGRFPVPHGVVCARLLAPVMRANMKRLRDTAPGSPALERYHEIAQVLTGRPEARPEDGAEWVAELVAELRIPPLAGFGVAEHAFDEIAAQARRSSSMQGNPVALTDTELAAVLREA